jgi:hypothetical protein
LSSLMAARIRPLDQTTLAQHGNPAFPHRSLGQ